MSLVVPLQPSCVETWRKAVAFVDKQPGHKSHNVVLTIEAPTTGAQLGDKRVAVVEDFLGSHGKSLRTIANTIFPQSLYQRYGSCLLYTSPSPRDATLSRMPSSA